jgi:hypothetical protein
MQTALKIKGLNECVNSKIFPEVIPGRIPVKKRKREGKEGRKGKR